MAEVNDVLILSVIRKKQIKKCGIIDKTPEAENFLGSDSTNSHQIKSWNNFQKLKTYL